MLSTQQWAQLRQFTQQVLDSDHTGHGMDHIDRVVAIAEQLAQQTPAAKRDIVVVAALLHDTYDQKLVNDVAAAKANTAQAMQTAAIAQDDQQAIFAIIDQMSYRYQLDHPTPLSLEGQLVQDADRLDAIGAIGIARTFYYGGAHDTPMYQPDVAPRSELDGQTYRQQESSVINHFYEKLLLLQDLLNTDAAKKIAQHRQQVMLDFLDEFKAEWRRER